MSDLNKVMLIARLGADPELRYTQGGTPVVNLRAATTEKYNDSNGERQEKTEWHNLVAFGKTAELCNNYLQKGSQAYFEGRLQTREWEDRDGNKRRTNEVVFHVVQFLGRAQGQSQGGGYRGGGHQAPGQPAANGGAQWNPADDDYPF